MNTRPKILYIDDESENLVGFKVSFSKDFEIFTAENTISGLGILKREDISVALVDFKMSNEDGISFIERIKDKFSDVIFIVISGYADLDAVIKAINMNCLKNFIQKPWNYNEMRIVLKNAVESHQIKKENKMLLEMLLQNNTQLQESLERERKLHELKSVFLRNFSHEIRTPLNAIVGFANLALNETNNSTVKNHIELCIQNSYELLKVLESIILASVITTEKISIHMEVFSPSKLVDEIIGSRAKSFMNKPGVKFVNETDKNILITNDKDKVKAAFEFLIDNAFKFTDNGCIKVSAEKIAGSSGEITFHVSDTGIGIPPEKMDVLYKPFRQCDESFGRNYGGNGLGLFITKSLVELLGGKISCKSEVDKGSVFSFTVTRHM